MDKMTYKERILRAEKIMKEALTSLTKLDISVYAEEYVIPYGTDEIEVRIKEENLAYYDLE